MVLVGADPLAPNATVRFDIVLTSGASVVTGEGRVLEHVAATDGRPAGLRVRFQKLDDASKGVLKRALEMQKRKSTAKRVVPPASGPGEVASSPSNDAPQAPQQTAPVSKDDAVPSAKSGVQNALAPAAAPENRDELLNRLRERAKAVKIDVLLGSKRSAAAE